MLWIMKVSRKGEPRERTNASDCRGNINNLRKGSIMRKLTILLVMVISGIIGSCKCNEEATKALSEMKETQQELKKIATNVKKIEKEKATETEEDKEIWSEKNIELLGLNVKERKISDETWQKANKLNDVYKDMEKEDLKALTPEKINQMLLNAGFDNADSAKEELKKIAESLEFNIQILMKKGVSDSSRALSGEEAYKKELKDLGDYINKKGYSPQDIKVIDENKGIIRNIAEVIYRLNQ
jgi:hypothetical protein